MLDYSSLADFRYHTRAYLRFGEEIAHRAGIEPQQFQLMLALRGSRHKSALSLREIAEQMLLRHNSVVELVDRCERARLVARVRDASDARVVRVHLTKRGAALLQRLTSAHLRRLREDGKAMIASLRPLLAAKEVA
jgi:DNA-binding MarR family transcriptional regulator